MDTRKRAPGASTGLRPSASPHSPPSGPLPPALRQQLEYLAGQPAPSDTALRPSLPRRQSSCAAPDTAPPGCREAAVTEDGPTFMPLSRTTERVLRILLEGDLSRLRSESVAESLGISCTTLRRRLRCDHTSYQFLLDRSRQYRCEARLRERWLPGKCLADELGYLEVNSFYRAFRRWTGISYSEYRQRYH